MGIGYFRNGRQQLGREVERCLLLLQEKLERDRVSGRLPRRLDVLERGFISPEQVDAALDREARDAAARDDAAVATIRARRFALEASNQAQAQRSASMGIPLPLAALTQRFGLDDFSRDVLLLAVAAEVDDRLRKLFGFLQNDITRQHLDVGLALELLCDSAWAADAGRDDLLPHSPLFEHRLLIPPDDVMRDDLPLLRMALRPSLRVVEFLRDGQGVDHALRGACEVHAPKTEQGLVWAPAVEAQISAVVARWRADPVRILVVRGESGSGRTALASLMCAAVDKPRVSLRAAQCTPELLGRALREVRLRDGVLHLYGLGQGAAPLCHAACAGGVPLVIEAAPDEAFLPESPWTELRLEMPALAERVQIWARALRSAGLDEGCSEQLAVRMRVLPGVAMHAAAEAASQHPQTPQSVLGVVEHSVRAQSPHALGTLARRVERRAAWSQLVLDSEARGQLQELVEHYRHRHTLLSRWGFDGVLTTGQGISALFEGPPGTGKTMAAGALSREFDMELFQIDCARIVSKYIGETEKNLARIFDEGQKARAVLLFDEADSLFGKRTEVKSSNDRHANLEVNYLLQRMDSYRGIVLLTTNFGGGIDGAFMRRLTSVVHFGVPDAAARMRLWEVLMPEAFERSRDVNLEALAEMFEMSGGHIKNAIVRAAVSAAQAGRAANHMDFVEAGRAEYRALGKLVRG